MSDTNTGGPAYPTSNWENLAPRRIGYSEGMTLRDYFAAKAMQGILSHERTVQATHDAVALQAYTMADAMLKARAA